MINTLPIQVGLVALYVAFMALFFMTLDHSEAARAKDNQEQVTVR